MKKSFCLVLVMLLLALTGCSSKDMLPEITIDDAKITELAEIATNFMEQSEICKLRNDYLSLFGNETQAPSITHAIEVRTGEKSAHTAMHIYVMHVMADWLDESFTCVYDSLNIVYDCETGKTYSNIIEPFKHGFDGQVEYSKEFYIASALNLGILQSSLPENWSIFNTDEKHAAFDAQQLQTLNEQFHPIGWEYREEVIINMDGDSGENQSVSHDKIDTGERIQTPEITDQEMPQAVAIAINSGFKNRKFTPNELIDNTIISAKEYSIIIDEEDTPVHLVYVWMNGNTESGIYAGQVVIDLDTGDILFASDFDESKINFEAIDIYYFYWLGQVAFDGSACILNDSETLVPLTDALIGEIQELLVHELG